ncbi:hypothetical protein X798_01821 [Onchocerca flexuosa]|uniref:TRAF3-interacting protein 1 N-terminal domain-containing protein n=1 Tax=Onchocerca flexuosa TaxID=387005 RepID=A0A238C1K4_9BILA|nr:hypothetical protein X798_01821 [Onchocerca flexuosa]
MYTEKTKELFACLIDRPLLTDQLLQRPPFRFLHDIVKITIQNTGFLMNNFTNEEMDAATITDKTAKTSFLKKLIKALNDDGSLKDVKVAKIIAGKEPEMTNLVERDRRYSSKSKEKRKKESEYKTTIIKQTVGDNKRKDSINERHFKDIAPETLPTNTERMIHTDQEPTATTKMEDSVIVDKIINETEQPLISPTLKEQARLSTSSVRPRTSLSRLGTAAARPAPPKIKKKRVEEIERKPEINIKTSGLIVGERKQSDEYFIVEDEPSYDQSDQTNADELVIEEHGSLVRKILETKKGLEDQIRKEAYNAAISVFDENDQAKSQKELADLQKTMQQITQITHLFARFLDNAQEDAESMFKEMEDWRLESTKNIHNLRERKASAEGTSESLLLRLNQLDEQIKEVKNAIVQTKAKELCHLYVIKFMDKKYNSPQGYFIKKGSPITNPIIGKRNGQKIFTFQG